MNKNVNILLKQTETLWSSKSDTLFTDVHVFIISQNVTIENMGMDAKENADFV